LPISSGTLNGGSSRRLRATNEPGDRTGGRDPRSTRPTRLPRPQFHSDARRQHRHIATDRPQGDGDAGMNSWRYRHEVSNQTPGHHDRHTENAKQRVGREHHPLHRGEQERDTEAASRRRPSAESNFVRSEWIRHLGEFWCRTRRQPPSVVGGNHRKCRPGRVCRSSPFAPRKLPTGRNDLRRMSDSPWPSQGDFRGAKGDDLPALLPQHPLIRLPHGGPLRRQFRQERIGGGEPAAAGELS